MTASCGQLGQKYADYGVNPVSGLDHAYSCPRDNKMEVSALTHAKWYGAPAPVFAAPDAVLEERGLLVNGAAGRWTNKVTVTKYLKVSIRLSKYGSVTSVELTWAKKRVNLFGTQQPRKC